MSAVRRSHLGGRPVRGRPRQRRMGANAVGWRGSPTRNQSQLLPKGRRGGAGPIGCGGTFDAILVAPLSREVIMNAKNKAGLLWFGYLLLAIGGAQAQTATETLLHTFGNFPQGATVMESR